MNTIIEKVRRDLKQHADEKTRESGQRFFKEKINLYGVKSNTVKKIGKTFYNDIRNSDKEEIFKLCDELWRSGNVEESMIACNWSYYLHKRFEPGDFELFEKWIDNYVNNWASCDTFCNHTVGAFVEMYPDYLSRLKKWAKSSNRWMRRAAAVSLIIPARQGKFLKDIFEIADILLLDPDDMVQKGYGWMLKVASQVHRKQVYDYVIRNKQVMPRTALRYAIEKMPEELKNIAMAK
jgi:3-methyladenine DNA glycosylase AlkD